MEKEKDREELALLIRKEKNYRQPELEAMFQTGVDELRIWLNLTWAGNLA